VLARIKRHGSEYDFASSVTDTDANGLLNVGKQFATAPQTRKGGSKPTIRRCPADGGQILCPNSDWVCL
jgi:hypothetical protein